MPKLTNPTSQIDKPPARNEALEKALFLLSRPASLGAMAVLLLNDHLLRRLWPSWWTGKLGDFAWLYFIPFAAAALLALLLPRRLGRREDLVGWLALGTIGGVFALAKTLPVFHAWLVPSIEALLGFPVGWQRDPTDLIALVSLAAAWVTWQRTLRPLPGGVQGQAGFENLEVGFKAPPSPQPSPSKGEGAVAPSPLRGEPAPAAPGPLPAPVVRHRWPQASLSPWDCAAGAGWPTGQGAGGQGEGRPNRLSASFQRLNRLDCPAAGRFVDDCQQPGA